MGTLALLGYAAVRSAYLLLRGALFLSLDTRAKPQAVSDMNQSILDSDVTSNCETFVLYTVYM